jgi:hypothetical protein
MGHPARTQRTMACGTRHDSQTMVLRLTHSAEQHGRVHNGSTLLYDVLRGVEFVDGEKRITLWSNSDPQHLAISLAHNVLVTLLVGRRLPTMF